MRGKFVVLKQTHNGLCLCVPNFFRLYQFILLPSGSDKLKILPVFVWTTAFGGVAVAR